MKTKTVTSAGGVVFDLRDGSIEVALTARRGDGRWGLPKGLVEKGEALEEAALREVSEESGLTGEIVDKIDRIDYWFYWRPDETRYHKYVHFFLVRHTGGDISKHDWEVEEVRWFKIDDAIDKLAFKSEKMVLEKAKKKIKELKE